MKLKLIIPTFSCNEINLENILLLNLRCRSCCVIYLLDDKFILDPSQTKQYISFCRSPRYHLLLVSSIFFSSSLARLSTFILKPPHAWMLMCVFVCVQSYPITRRTDQGWSFQELGWIAADRTAQTAWARGLRSRCALCSQLRVFSGTDGSQRCRICCIQARLELLPGYTRISPPSLTHQKKKKTVWETKQK